MIIKRWNGSAFVKEFPQTKAQLIRNAGDTESVFDGNDKIKPAFLPDSVFDSLHFISTASFATQYDAQSGPGLLSDLADYAFDELNIGRSVLGAYFVANETIELSSNTSAVVGSYDASKYYITRFTSTDEGGLGTAGSMGSANLTTLETGDWIVITNISGAGTVGNPYIVIFAIVENTYELATTGADGIVRLSSQSTYASLSGNNVITDGRLKTLIDNAAFAAASHAHGNITNTGTITTNTAASSGQHLVITSSANLIEQSAIELGTTTTTFLNNAGAWATPAGTYAHPTFTARSVDTSGVDVLDTFTSNTDGHVTGIATRTLPNATTSLPGVMSAADKTKLDGIATGATANTGTVTSVGGTGTISGLTLSGTVTTSGNLTLGGTLAVLPSNFASQSANTFLVAPNGSAGAPTFRALATADIPTAAVTLDKLQNSPAAGLSVVARTTNSAGSYVDLSAGSDHQVLRRSGTGLAFALLTGSNLTTNTVANANLVNMAQNTIKGRISASTGAPEDLTATNVRSIIEVAGPIYVQTATPTTSVTHALWYDIN
jgi:hypothetical protein